MARTLLVGCICSVLFLEEKAAVAPETVAPATSAIWRGLLAMFRVVLVISSSVFSSGLVNGLQAEIEFGRESSLFAVKM
ncbi:MAG: hypothetical protein HKN02_05190 [Rhodobacteraceae bacterium]|nr:hypothetical protein [Paracoccaceae bacterium]